MRFSKAIGTAGWSVAGQVTPPAIWGKLPTHADYLQHAVRADEVRGWQRWLSSEMPVPQHQKPSGDTRSRRAHKWVLLEPGRYKPAPSSIPVAFVLPAGTVSFAPDQYVVGVIASSCDRLGREHPMLVYQRANRRWLNQCLASGGKSDRHCDPSNIAERLEQQNWLFWLARLVSRYVAQPEQASSLWTEDGRDGSAAAVSDAQAPATTGLETAVAQLWAHYAPGWSQWVGVPKPRPTLAQLQKLIDNAAPARDFDAADNLRGVGHLPWADWPSRLEGPLAKPAFWQQDACGGYVGATQRLADLWERRQ